VSDGYPPVRQLETIKLEAERQAQLRRERREVATRKATSKWRSWRMGTRALMRLFGYARKDERLTPLGCAERGEP
jgi:hypothetical protein